MLSVKVVLREWSFRLMRWTMKSAFKIILLTLAALFGQLVLATAGEMAGVPVVRAAAEAGQKRARAATGTIAYVQDGKVIRLIEPDGSNDRLAWTSPIPNENGVTEVAWNPTSTEIAFVSDHEGVVSFYERDVYAIRPDGSGYRKLTNAPIHEDLTTYAKGIVVVDVYVAGSGGPFHVYVSGAPLPQTVIAGSPGTQTLIFTDVADFGNTLQPVVAIDGEYRWFSAGTLADVKPGQTVDAGTLSISGQGEWHFGVYPDLLTWRGDGSRIGFLFGPGCLMRQAAASPPPGVADEPLLQHSLSGWTCAMDWAPLPSLANQVLVAESDPFSQKGHIYRMTEGNTNPGEPLITFDLPNSVLSLEWLPDGSGFLFTFINGAYTESNIYAYSFATEQISQLTSFTGELAGQITISPDGQQVVFERSADATGPTELWMMNRDGSDLHLLVSDGSRPSWSSGEPQVPPPPPPQQFSYIPVSLR
jgi:TolB protein